MAAIQIQGLRALHGASTVIDGLDLEVERGEFLVLLGPSGCGKTTLLHSIAGLKDVAAGRVLIDGQDLTDAEPGDRNIAMVFQSYALYPSMTVEQNLSFGLKARGVPRAEIQRRVRAASEMLQIDRLLGRRPSQLSGGQRQRVAIGRALVREAAVFLFDEPLSSLDAQLRADLRREIKLLHARLGATVVYVTHDQVEAMTLATRVAVMREGRLQQVATPREIYERPANLFVATFVGSPVMNQLRGHVGRVDGGSRFRAEGFELDLGAVQFAGLSSSAEVVLGVRPEAVRVSTAGGLRAKVRLVEMLGAHQVVWVEVAGQALAGIAPAATHLAAGDEVGIDIDAAACRLFAATTGERLRDSGEGPVS